MRGLVTGPAATLAVALIAGLSWPGWLGRGEASAQTKSITLDSVTLEPSRLTGFSRLRAYVSALTLEGESLELNPGDVRLMVGGSSLRAPHGTGRFGLSDADLSVVVVVESTFEYTAVLPTIQDALVEELLAKLPDRTRIAVVGYGESVQSGKLANLKAARSRLAALSPDLGPAEPAMIEAVEHALALFRRFKTTPPGRPMRKVILLLSDGRDRLEDRDRVTQVGQRANREGARIFTLAFSPTNTRRPLLNLGELSKQSHGTFRWLRTGEKQSWQAQLQRVREQIEGQLVFTYFVDDGDDGDNVAGKRVQVAATIGNTELQSNELKIPQPSCGAQPCSAGQWCLAGGCVTPRAQTGRGVLGWLLMVIGLGAAVLVVTGGVGFWLARRQAKAPRPPGAPGGFAGGPGNPANVGHSPATGAYPPGSQPPGIAQVASAMPAAPPAGPTLYIASGPRAGQRLAIFHGFSIGKAPTCSLVIDDGYASTDHAQIVMDGRGFCTIYDRGSTNGTFVNGVRITEMPLEHGAAVRIGATELRFLTE
jgi:FHA domain/von Willebrand factor type A domain